MPWFWLPSNGESKTMLMKRVILLLISCIILTGCKTTNEYLAEGYKGRTAVLSDSSAKFVETTIFLPAQVDFFYAESIDGKSISNALGRTATRFRGLGLSFVPVGVQRRVPAKQITVDIVGSTYHGAPIGALFRKSYLVRGTVKFRPAPGRRYVVRGRLSERGSSVWIQTTGGRVVGRKIVARNQ